MKIEKILQGIKQEKAPAKEPEKTANEKPVVAAAPAAALATAVAAAAPEKTASETPAAKPVADLNKIASELLAADQEAAVKEAQVLGAAFGKALVAELAGWQKAAQEMLAAAPAATATLIPGVDQNLLKQAAEVGYNQARMELEKVAGDEYDRGWNETVEAIYQTAGNEFLKAAAVTEQLIEAAAS